MNYIKHLLFLSIIIILEDLHQNNIYIDMHKLYLPSNENSINIYNETNYEVNNRNVKCNKILDYKSSKIITRKNLSLLECDTKSYFGFIKCNDSKQCSMKITNIMNYKCFPKYLCNVDLFNRLNAIIIKI